MTNEPKDPKRVAAGKRSKAKGATWQRDVAKLLSDWSGETFKSTPRSGGLRWGGAFWVYGDLTPPADFPVVFECKHYATVDFLEILGTNQKDPGVGLVQKWYHEELLVDVLRASTELGIVAKGFLCWKPDHRRSRITMDLDLFNRFGIYTLVTVVTGVPGKTPFITLDLVTFLRSMTYEHFKSVILTP